MHSQITLHTSFTSTGIVIEARDGSGRVVASREIGKAKMQHWVSEHADRQAAVEFDQCITNAVNRHENPRGNLAGLFDQAAFIVRLGSGIEEIAS